jgi:hypothetical protein
MGDVAEDEDRRSDPGAAQLDRFVDAGDTQPDRATCERGFRDRHGTVAIRVRLDDREQPDVAA